MTGKLWVKTTALCLTKNPLDVEQLQGYEDYMRREEPDLLKSMTQNKSTNISGLNAFYTNTKHVHGREGVWDAMGPRIVVQSFCHLCFESLANSLHPREPFCFTFAQMTSPLMTVIFSILLT